MTPSPSPRWSRRARRAGFPTGTVTFNEGSNVLGTAPVTTVGGRARPRSPSSSLRGGSHAIKATYSGDATYAASTSAAYTQVVERAASTLVVNSVIEQFGDHGGRVRAALTGNGGAARRRDRAFTTTQNVGTGRQPDLLRDDGRRPAWPSARTPT